MGAGQDHGERVVDGDVGGLAGDHWRIEDGQTEVGLDRLLVVVLDHLVFGLAKDACVVVETINLRVTKRMM